MARTDAAALLSAPPLRTHAPPPADTPGPGGGHPGRLHLGAQGSRLALRLLADLSSQRQPQSLVSETNQRETIISCYTTQRTKLFFKILLSLGMLALV